MIWKKKKDASGEAPDPELSSEPRRRKARHTRVQIILRVLFVFLLILVLLASICLRYLNLWKNGQWQPSEAQMAFIMRLADSTELMQSGKTLKNDMKDLASSLKLFDVPAAEAARAKVLEDVAHIRVLLDKPVWRLAARLPAAKDKLATVNELLMLVEEADNSLIGPCLGMLEAYPLSSLKVDNGISVDTVLAYLDFFEQVLPEAESLYARFQALDLGFIGEQDILAAYSEKAEYLLGLGDSARDLIPVMRSILGYGGDRVYLFAAQNSSELRGSGGFPGAMGFIRIRDGVLSVSDFTSVYEVLQQHTPAGIEISEVENLLFDGRLHSPWDADFTPDFERVAYIWANSYAVHTGETLDGIVSATPVIIQKLLSFLGSITLSDGTELNGDNATRVLGHDLYFHYLGADRHPNGEQIVDALFAESARKTLELVFSDISPSRMLEYYAFMLDSFGDRSLMIWLADEPGQTMIRELGWNAGLNTDPMKPEIGIFYNSTSASKMTWYLDIIPELSDPVVNEDGSRSYELTLTLANVMTEEERQQASTYILGYLNGIVGSIYIFAPSGGTIGSFETNSHFTMNKTVYEDLELGYLLNYSLGMQPLVIRCQITTAPGAEEPIRIVVPPTMTAYR